MADGRISDNLFLDANIYLSFYHLSDDDQIELEKLVRLVVDGDVSLFSNRVLRDEVWRFRAEKIRSGLSEFKKMDLTVKAPSFLRSHSEFPRLLSKIKEVKRCRNEILQSIESSVAREELRADNLIRDLFSASRDVPISDELLNRARFRLEVGNPPGKDRSLNDRIHWETILKSRSGSRPSIGVVSDDGDFANDLDPEEIKPFLRKEFCDYKEDGHHIKLYRRLSDYLKDRHPEIDLNDENDKDEYIEQLNKSTTYQQSHRLVAKLSGYQFFTKRQTERLIDALIDNTQVFWIAEDYDIRKFYFSVFEQSKVNFWMYSRFEEARMVLPFEDVF